MEKPNNKVLPFKNAAFYTKKTREIRHRETEADIRIGISLADEEAKEELKKRKINAPLSIEERLFLSKPC